MSAEEKLVKKVFSAGSAGVKKTDLRKELGAEVDAQLEGAISNGEIFVDKRAGAYYCFHKQHYVQSLLNSDPRFRLTYDMINSVSKSAGDLVRAVETLAGNISNLSRAVMEIKTEQSLLSMQPAEPAAAARRTMSVQEFKNEFDATLANSASSIGWVELAKIRNELCTKCDISADEFYRLVGELTGQYPDKYELSTGGSEGVMVRGLLHGLVRCI